MNVFQNEGARKLFHSLSAGYALLYAWSGRTTTLWVLGAALGVSAVVEAVRLRNPRVNEFLLSRFGGIHREKEIDKPSGIFWTLGGCVGVVALVPARDIVLASMLYLTVGDGLAGFVGRNWGRFRIGAKSLEGSLAAFLGCWAVGALTLNSPFGRAEVLWGALGATALEALDLPPDDNFTLPLLSGLGLWAARAFL
ncbi:MAG: hypothetical protein IPP68_10070 [Elusimicrobia bacterium]|nr:hypothetical protein [Elusimicrobiota bacterium]